MKFSFQFLQVDPLLNFRDFNQVLGWGSFFGVELEHAGDDGLELVRIIHGDPLEFATSDEVGEVD